jgi:hypothetical protein
VDDEMLTDLLAAAMLKSACAEAKCRVSAEVHKWWIYVVHLDDHAHTCPGCDWGEGYPRRFIAMSTLYGSDRGVLVADLSRWLTHLHVSQDAASSGSGGDGTPLDGDTPSGASFDGDTVGAGAAADGHRVGSGRPD